jgi:hypothetical protein
MLQAGKSWIRFPMRSSVLFNLRNPSNRSMTLGLTQPLNEVNTNDVLGKVKRGRRIILTTSPPSVRRSHVTTGGRSVSMSGCQAHSATCDQILLSVRRLIESCLVSVGHPL